MATDTMPENLSTQGNHHHYGDIGRDDDSPKPPPMLQPGYPPRLDPMTRMSPGSSHSDPSPPLRHEAPPGHLPASAAAAAAAFNAAALCDQFCSVINGFRGFEPPSRSSLKSHSSMSSGSSRSVASDATECRLIDYRGEKIAAFVCNGEYLLCLPQAFELFLKHLVGGLHTVYTKLKRLGISPIVCNVEQVRILRGLGAIQPGVNRCKLLSCKDFDSLYKDCTTARPGRPPRRASLVGLGLNVGPVGYPPLLKPGEMDYENGIKSEGIRSDDDAEINIPAMLLKMWNQGNPADKASYPNGISPAAAAAALSSQMDTTLQMMGLNHPNAYQRSLLSGGLSLPLASIAQAHLSRQDCHKNKQYAGLDLGTQGRTGEDLQDSFKDKMYNYDSGRKSKHTDWPSEGENNSALNLSQNGIRDEERDPREGKDEEEDNESDYPDDKEGELSDESDVSTSSTADLKAPDKAESFLQFAENSGILAAQGISSIETLLQNILGLLKVAEENARQQERQVSMEKAELKVEIMREREVRENLEKKLQEEQSRRIFYQKRLRREKRCRRQVQDQLESEMKKRARYEEALRTTVVETHLPKESLQEEIKSEDNVAMESDNSIKSR